MNADAQPFDEHALGIECESATMVAVLALPRSPAARGVLIVVGGPQYRAGSHRQFTLLARHLASRGIPAMRFDYRGMGDSEGETRSFEQVDPDLRCALDAFFARVPELRDVVIWGLCDAASAAMFYAHRDARVSGVVLVNPWVRTVEGKARAQLKHYYTGRLADPGLWRKIGRGEFDLCGAVKGVFGSLRQALRRRAPAASERPLPERMADGFAQFHGNALFVMSGEDLTAQEFKDAAAGSKRWRELIGSPRVTWRDFPQANHTFSTRQWRDQAAAWTADWVRSW